MAEIDSIFSIIMIFVISVSIFFIFNTFYLNDIITNYEQNLVLDKYQYNLNKFETLILLKDPYSGNNFFIDSLGLLVNHTHYDTINYGMVDKNLWYKKQLDNLFGENNYYFNINYDIKNFSFVFLYDDGEFIKNIDNQQNFSKLILNLYNQFDDLNYNFNMKVYILTKNENSLECERYLSIKPNLACEVIIAQADSYYDEFENPYYYFYLDPENRSLIDERFNIYALNDWSTYILKVLKEDYENKASSYTNKVILFFLSDVVNLGYPKSSIIATDNILKHYNQICDNYTDFSISDYSLDKLDYYISDSYYTIFPIKVWDDNSFLPYKEEINNYLNNPSNDDYCNPTKCPGCTGTDGNAQIHPEARDKHRQQLELIANSSNNGEVIDYTSSSNLANILSNYLNSVIDKTSFSIGDKKNEIKQIFEKNIFINVNGDFVKFNLYLEIYDNPYNFTGDLDYINII